MCGEGNDELILMTQDMAAEIRVLILGMAALFIMIAFIGSRRG